MQQKIDDLLKLSSIITLICFICGFVIMNTFLAFYGIIDVNIFNVRYFNAGILYFIIAPFILTTQAIIRWKINLLASISIALFAFYMFNVTFGISENQFNWKIYLIVLVLNTISYFLYNFLRDEIKNNKYDLSDTPLISFYLIIISLILFGIYFKDLNNIFGGGKTFKKVFILKDKKDGITKTNNLNRTDTLSILYENDEFIYFKNSKNVQSIKRDLIDGEIIIR